MDNRFGVKDFFLFSLLAVLLVAVLLAMKQFDRQHDRVKTIQAELRQVTDDIARLSRRLNDMQTVAVVPNAGGGTGATTTPVPPPGTGVAVNADGTPVFVPSDPFYLVRNAQKMPGYAEGDWLLWNLGTKLGKITPLVSSDTYATMVQSRVVEPLLVRDPYTLKWQPLLAASWEIHPDGQGVTYKLRTDVKFSDGTPMTAADVKGTFDLIMEPELDAARSRSYLNDNGLTVEVVDDYTVKFRLSRPYYEMLNITGGTGIIPKGFYSKYTPRQINDNPGLLMGTGPFRVLEGPDSWRPGKRLVLTRNERYWGITPPLNRIVYLEVSEETVSSTMLRNGDLDYMPATPDQFKKLKADPTITEKNQDFTYQSMLGGYTYVAWNQKRGDRVTPFADKRVRQAMTMMIDRERLANDLYGGFATVATGPFSSNGPQSNKTIKPWPYDVTRAKAMLKEAGYEDRNGDGVLEDAEGKNFAFEFMYPSGSAFSERIALFMKDQFARGGVVAELKPTDWPVMVERLKKSQFDVTSLGWSSSVESDLYQIFHSSQQGDAGDNRTGYSNPELDAIIEKARAEVNDEVRYKLWQQACAILHEDQPYTFLLERQALAFYSKRIKNVQKTRMGMNFMPTESRVPPWFVPQGEQKYLQN